jgi:hypothetical protein
MKEINNSKKFTMFFSRRNKNKTNLINIDIKTISNWSAPYRNWKFYPDYIISGDPKINGFEDVI